MRVNKFVGAILINSEGKVLLQLRPETEIYYPSFWTLPGGKVEENESAEQALEREIHEELGIELVGYNLFKKTREHKGNSIIERYIYWSKIDKKIEDFRLGEGSQLQFFSKDQINSLKIAFQLKGIIKTFLKNPTK